MGIVAQWHTYTASMSMHFEIYICIFSFPLLWSFFLRFSIQCFPNYMHHRHLIHWRCCGGTDSQYIRTNWKMTIVLFIKWKPAVFLCVVYENIACYFFILNIHSERPHMRDNKMHNFVCHRLQNMINVLRGDEAELVWTK